MSEATETLSSPAELADLPTVDLPGEGWTDRALTGFGTALDTAVVRAMQIVVERALIPNPENVEALRDSAQEVLDPELQADPKRFFAFLEQPPHPLRMKSRYRRSLDGGSVISRRIESDYVPYTTDVDASDGPILVEHWVHENRRPRGTVLALHGFTMGRPRIDANMLMAKHWYRRGLNVALLTLPHHGARTARGARFSGEQFAVPHVTRLSEGVREAVYEIRQVVHWLREESGAPTLRRPGLRDPDRPARVHGRPGVALLLANAPCPGWREGDDLAAGAAARLPNPLPPGPPPSRSRGTGHDRRGAGRPGRPARTSGRTVEALGQARDPLVQWKPPGAVRTRTDRTRDPGSPGVDRNPVGRNQAVSASRVSRTCSSRSRLR
jgi:hypothetical protein